MPKNNRPRDFNDLRPVALTSVAMKCFEKIMFQQFLSEVSPLSDPNQVPQRAERGVEDVLLIYEDL